MKCTKFGNIILGCFVLISSMVFLPDLASARRIKENGILTPEEVLVKQGYYMCSRASSESSQIKMVSFDWGGVLSRVVNDKEFANKVKRIFELLKSRGIKIVITSEGGNQEIKNELKSLGLEQYIEDIYQAYSKEPTRTKRAILEDIARSNGYGDNQIVHFEDNPALIEKISFKIKEQPHIIVIGVVGREISDVRFREDARDILEVASIAIINLEIGLDKILKLLGLKGE